MILSYTTYEKYLNCPRQYKYMIDNTKVVEKENKYFALYGILIQKFFKEYVNKILPQKTVVDDAFIKSELERLWNKVLKKNYVDWDAPYIQHTAEEIFEQVYTDILENIKAFDFFKQCSSEVTISIKLKKSGDVLDGRLDFIRKCPDGSVEILDGKGTNKLERANPDQLLFYALLYFLHTKTLPKRLGFLYYRFKIIKYIDLNQDIFLKFKNKLAVVKDTIKKDTAYQPTLKLSKVCVWCPYNLLCKPCLDKKEANSKKRSKMDLNPGGEIISLGGAD